MSTDATTSLQLPFLMPAQAQKHVTVNAALLRLDALVQTAALSATTAAQPASPTDGDLYLLPAAKTGAAWGAMTSGALAYWRDGVWEQLTPRDGWLLYVVDADTHLVRVGGAWRQLTPAAQSRGFRNRLINSAFAYNQRQATSVADDAYCFDRFYVLTESGSVGVSALTDPEAGRLTGIRLTQPDATAKRIGLAQIVESTDIRDLRSASAAMAARVRCSASQAIRVAILEWTGTADAVTSDIINNWSSSTYTPGNFFIAGVNVIAVGAATPAAATWTDMGPISGSFGASMTNAIVVVWSEAALAQNATLDLDQIQLEAGKVCGPFARRSESEELAACLRFYQKSFLLGTAPAQAIGTNTGEWLWPASAAGAATQRGTPCRFGVRMRASPTMTGFSPSAANADAYDTTAGAECSASNFFSATPTQFGVTTLGAAGTAVGNRLGIHWTAEAEL
jgi:hypothetical protein